MTGAAKFRIIINAINVATIQRSSSTMTFFFCLLSSVTFSTQMLHITVPLISVPLFLPPFSFSLICHTHCKEANPCSSEIWVHLEECVSFLTLQRSLSTNKRSRRGAGGREEDVEMLGTVWEREKKESSLWPLIWQDMKQLNGFGIWQNSFLQWAFTTRGIPWREATYVWAAIRTQGEWENFRKRTDSRRVF